MMVEEAFFGITCTRHVMDANGSFQEGPGRVPGGSLHLDTGGGQDCGLCDPRDLCPFSTRALGWVAAGLAEGACER